MLTALTLTACGGIDPQQYVDAKPATTLEAYFNGPITAQGLIQDYSRNVVSRFDVKMVGTWEGNTGTLAEDFMYYDGSTQRRVWTITKTGPNTYIGRADDIIGEAKGQQYGNAIHWVYEMDVPVKDKKIRLTFDDWMWLMNDGVIINRSYMKKLGITVAEITLHMKKETHDE
jgi:hypothetical protein